MYRPYGYYGYVGTGGRPIFAVPVHGEAQRTAAEKALEAVSGLQIDANEAWLIGRPDEGPTRQTTLDLLGEHLEVRFAGVISASEFEKYAGSAALHQVIGHR